MDNLLYLVITKVHQVQQTTQLPVVQSTINPQEQVVVVGQQVHKIGTLKWKYFNMF